MRPAGGREGYKVGQSRLPRVRPPAFAPLPEYIARATLTLLFYSDDGATAL